MKSFSAKEVAAWVGGRIANEAVLGPTLEQIRIERPSELASSQATDVAFFFSKNYQADLMKAAPGVLITGEPFVKPLEASGLPLWKKTAILVCADPYLAMAQTSKALAPLLSTVVHLGREKQAAASVHPSAVVHSSVELGKGVRIDAHCVIEEGAKIGDGSVLYPGCFVGPRSTIGRDCVLFPRVSLYEWTQLGDRVRLHAGVVLGADGFGYAPRRDGARVLGHEKIHHLGRVVLGNDVEVGANTCIDRGTLGDTVVRDMAKIDDMVMIGHNCQIDIGAVICGTVGMAGRARVGKFAYVGGGAGISNDIHIGDGAMVGGHCVVTKDVEAGATVAGHPMRDFKEHFKIQAMLSRMMAERKKARSSADSREEEQSS